MKRRTYAGIGIFALGVVLVDVPKTYSASMQFACFVLLVLGSIFLAKALVSDEEER